MTQSILTEHIKFVGDLLWQWPFLAFILLSGFILSIALRGIQFRYFFTAWKMVLFPKPNIEVQKEGELSSFQAFINALSASMGNGSLAGMAVAIAQGGPGVAFWIFVLGFLILPIRYAEVYASSAFAIKNSKGILNGGPMAYLSLVPGGSFLPFCYAFFLLALVFVANAMQCNSMGLGLYSMTSCRIEIIGLVFLLFLAYVMLGGAHRIIKASEIIVPIKVAVFFITTTILLIYNYAEIVSALLLILKSALMPQTLYGVATGFTIQYAISSAASKVINASEVGLGTAGVLFGATGAGDAVKNGVMSMVSAFISNYFVCFILCLCFVVTGVWNGTAQSTDMAIAAFSNVFGSFGGWIVTFLSLSFGIGVLVAYAFIGRECWRYLTGGRFFGLYNFLYCSAAFLGTVAKVEIVWQSVNIVNAGLLFLNIYGLLCLLPQITRGFLSQRNEL